MTPTGTLKDLRKSTTDRERANAMASRGDNARRTRYSDTRYGRASSTATDLDKRSVTSEPTRTTRAYQPKTPNRNRSRRLGSQQQVSVRGRRIAPVKTTNARRVRIIALVVFVAVLGIAGVMFFSGLTTEKTFQISEAEQKSETLSSELVTLQRDVEKAKSAQNVAAEASELGMVVPDQPGILDANSGKVHERRPADPEKSRPISDVNGETKQRGATSNPDETRDVPGLAPRSPAGAEATNNLSTGDVPYAPTP